MGGDIIVYIALVQVYLIPLVTGTLCNLTYTGKDNLQCYPCLPGFKKVDDCLVNYTQANCSPCQEGAYMSGCNTADDCLICTPLCNEPDMDILTNCTATTNSECQCTEGMYLTPNGNCQQHSRCTSGEGVKVAGNAFNDTICEDCVTGENYALDSSAYKECKPCTVCKTYARYCTPLKDAECQSTESTDVYHYLWTIVGISVGVFISMNVCACMLTIKHRRKLHYIKQNEEKENTPFLEVKNTPNLPDNLKDIYKCTQNPEFKSVQVVIPLISGKEAYKDISVETHELRAASHGASLVSDYRDTTESATLYRCQERRERIENDDFKRQKEGLLLSPDKTLNEVSVKGATHSDSDATTDIDWFRLFKILVPILPVDVWDWHRIAFELFDFCKQSKGVPKDIHNEVKQIESKSSNIYLAYHEVFQTWHRIMSDGATLDHIEQSLKILGNNIVMDEFDQIKSNPPLRHYPQKTDLAFSLVPYGRTEHFIPEQPNLFAYAQHETTYDTQYARGQRHFLQLTQFGEETKDKISQAFLQESLRHVHRRRLSGEKKNKSRYRMLKKGHTKVKKKVSRENSKLKEKLKATEKLEKRYIKTLKKLLPFEQIPVSRQEYNTFLDYLLGIIMDHNKVTRKVVLSITYKAYEEIAETKNGERYLLYGGNPKLNLDRKHYEYLQFYVKYARARVLRELKELDEEGDSIYLFLTYDGKSALGNFQRKESSLKKRTSHSEAWEMESTSTDKTGYSSSQSDLNEFSDVNAEDGMTSPREIVRSTDSSLSKVGKFTDNQETKKSTLPEKNDCERQMFPLCENRDDNETEISNGKDEDRVHNDDANQMFMEQFSYTEQLEAKHESVNSNIKHRKQDESRGNEFMNMSLNDLIENIDEELESSTFV